MSYSLIAFIVFLFSFLGLGSMVVRKVPVLVDLPETEVKKKEGSAKKPLTDRLKKVNPLENSSSRLFLQKLLKKIRILSLKTDNKMFDWLQKLKEDTQRKKIREDEEYWDEVKKATKK